jgi:hypothetical protein
MSTVWYFAYGSNMESATLRGRRGIEFRRALPARAPGWRLVLDKPSLLPLKEAFANIIADPSAEVFGVLYEIAAADLAHVDLTEGVFIGNYHRIVIPVEPLSPPAGPVTAFTLTSGRRDPSLRPSDRYMGLLIAGAVEHGLPSEYVAFLRSVPVHPETPEAAQFRPFIDQALRK